MNLQSNATPFIRSLTVKVQFPRDAKPHTVAEVVDDSDANGRDAFCPQPQGRHPAQGLSDVTRGTLDATLRTYASVLDEGVSDPPIRHASQSLSNGYRLYAAFEERRWPSSSSSSSSASSVSSRRQHRKAPQSMSFADGPLQCTIPTFVVDSVKPSLLKEELFTATTTTKRMLSMDANSANESVTTSVATGRCITPAPAKDVADLASFQTHTDDCSEHETTTMVSSITRHCGTSDYCGKAIDCSSLPLSLASSISAPAGMSQQGAWPEDSEATFVRLHSDVAENEREPPTTVTEKDSVDGTTIASIMKPFLRPAATQNNSFYWNAVFTFILNAAPSAVASKRSELIDSSNIAVSRPINLSSFLAQQGRRAIPRDEYNRDSEWKGVGLRRRHCGPTLHMTNKGPSFAAASLHDDLFTLDSHDDFLCVQFKPDRYHVDGGENDATDYNGSLEEGGDVFHAMAAPHTFVGDESDPLLPVWTENAHNCRGTVHYAVDSDGNQLVPLAIDIDRLGHSTSRSTSDVQI